MTKPVGEIQDCPINGLTYAYLGLAYNLYLLDHNAELQAYLVRRLKHSDTFYAAYYETHVAAWFILAGFTLAIENEQDSTRTHVEFIATIDGRSYSVEAKTRRAGKHGLDVGNQLYKALKKEASYPRMVFIDMNVGADVDYDQLSKDSIAAVRGRESRLKVGGEPAPAAYVFITNQPCHLALDREKFPRAPILTAELSDEELAAYKEHPQTFFGKVIRPPGRATTPMELFDFFLHGYKDTPRESLLEFFANSPDREELEKLSVEDLRLVYAERCTYSALQLARKPIPTSLSTNHDS